MEKLTVCASSAKYDVLIGGGLLKDAGKLSAAALPGAKTAVIVSDDNVFPLYGKNLEASLKSAGFDTLRFVFRHGETGKSLAVYGRLLEKMCRRHVTRSDAVFALGGGVAGDLAGFAAATYQRGIRFVQLPTTLLAAVDSSVGGKTGIDLKAGKNQAGCFHQPSLVICDTDTLSTLPAREYGCGCAEVIKYAVIGDEGFFEELEKTPVSAQYGRVIEKCVKAKSEYVRLDEFDTGVRMMLNLGHTIGHAAEMLSGYSLLHGEAVAMGMAAISRSAARRGICGISVPEAIIRLLEKYSLPVSVPFDAESVIKAAMSDKKSDGSSLRLIVPERIGKCVIETADKRELEKIITNGDLK